MRFTAFILFVSAVFAAPRCELDDCQLPVHLHDVGVEDDSTAYGWLVHDLAAARSAQRDRDLPRAGAVARDAHAALVAHADRVERARGKAFVLALHEALTEVMVASGYRAPEPPRLLETDARAASDGLHLVDDDAGLRGAGAS